MHIAPELRYRSTTTETGETVVVLGVAGVLDRRSVETLCRGILELTRRGPAALTVDLSAVTVLLGSATRRLDQTMRIASRPDMRVRLTASPGTVAHRVLACVAALPGSR